MIRPQWHILDKRTPGSVDEVMEILLANRKVGTDFISGSLKDLETHLSMRGVREGAELMYQHLAKEHKLLLVGDYDCDGITSTAQLALFLRDIGYRNYVVVIPHRNEGYGVPERAISEHADAKLLIALDCGTQDVSAVNLARSTGMDCIVIDHHEVPEKGLAPANILINPKQPSCPSSFKEFSSAGLTLLFLAALRRTICDRFPHLRLGSKYLALAAIGTVADIVPLVNANRIITKSGLCHLGQDGFLPLSEMINAAGLSGKSLTAGHIAYYLGPRINVAGRMGSAQMAFDLLMEDDPKRVTELARELNTLNSKRQKQEEVILTEVKRRYSGSVTSKRSLVMGAPNWPAGIIGIIASKIQQELHYGPTIVFSIDEDQSIARGSARSIAGIDIHAALQCCDRHLMRWGGHKMAAGLTCRLNKLEEFAVLFEEVISQYAEDIFIPRGRVDMEIDLSLISMPLLDMLEKLEPHGPGNPTPIFAAKGVRTKVQKAFGKDQQHLRLLVDGNIPGVFWRGSSRYACSNDDRVDVLFQVEWDSFSKTPSLNVKDVGHFFGSE